MPDASARLYARLNRIPINRKDPESLDDLIVCAIGASERYYVCWRTRDGAYRQDEYNLPPTLHAWLHPSDGSTRDFASLRVVFGFGEEFSASDRYGKVEYKEPRKKEKSGGSKPRDRRSSSIFSRSGSREKSTGRVSGGENRRSTPPREQTRNGEKMKDTEKMKQAEKETRVINRPRPLSKSFRRASKTANANVKEHEWMRNEERSPTSSKSKSPVTDASSSCACDCHDLVEKSGHKKQYSHASIQTDMRAMSSLSITSPPSPPSSSGQYVYSSPSPPSSVYRSMSPPPPSFPNLTTAVHDEETQASELEAPSPKDSMFLGHMLGFFSEPGYQLGDGLASRYGYGDGVGGMGVEYWDEEDEL